VSLVMYVGHEPGSKPDYSLRGRLANVVSSFTSYLLWCLYVAELSMVALLICVLLVINNCCDYYDYDDIFLNCNWFYARWQ